MSRTIASTQTINSLPCSYHKFVFVFVFVFSGSRYLCLSANIEKREREREREREKEKKRIQPGFEQAIASNLSRGGGGGGSNSPDRVIYLADRVGQMPIHGAEPFSAFTRSHAVYK